MNRSTTYASLGAAALVSLGLAGTPQSLSAQEQQRAGLIDEVVVTAQRREESLQDVAISMTVFNQQEIANANMVNSADIATYTPSLSVNTRFGPDNASFTMRGFTQDLRTTASVGVYFAEVVAPRGQTSQSSGDGAGPGMMFDLENIQVLKGPQGTLFGRNTTGGAVMLTPNRPTDEFEGHAEVSYGNYNLRQYQGVLNLPVHDRIKLRLGIDKKEREGHLNNITNIGADKLGDVDYIAGRLSAVVDVTDRLENYSILSYVDSQSKGYTSTLFACNDDPEELFEVAINIFTGPGCEQQLEHQRSTGQDGFYDVVSTVPNPRTDIEEMRFINTTTWDFTDNITAKGIFGYAHLETENESDVFGTRFRETQAALLPAADQLDNLLSGLLGISLPSITAGLVDPDREFSPGNTLSNPDYPVTSQETWVGELQLQGTSLGGRLQWQGGLYYENSRPDGVSGNDAAILINCDVSTIGADTSQANCMDISGGLLGSVLSTELETEYINQAVYGQGTYDIWEQLSVTLGLRYTWDETRGDRRNTRQTFVANQPGETITEETSPTQKSDAPTGMLEFQYRPFQDVMLYAKYTRGYRQGSVNLAADPGIDTFDQERVDTYEIGAKTEFAWPVPGRFNIALFDNDFTDMQLQGGYVSPTAGPTTAIFNAGKATIRGVEADGFFHLLPGLTAGFSFSYLDTELEEQDLAQNQQEVEEAGGPFAGFSFTPIADVGDELPFAPKTSYTISLNYTLPLPSQIGMVDVGGTYVYTGEQRATASSNTPFSMIDDYSLLNLHLNWLDVFGQPLDFSLFATNVRDEEYVTYLSGTFGVLGFDSRTVGMPRMYGMRLRYNF